MIISIGYSQEIDVWNLNNSADSSHKNIHSKSNVYELDIEVLKNILSKAKKRNEIKKSKKVLVSFPMPDNTKEVFEIFETSILSKKLQTKYPTIKSYYAKSINNPLNSIRFSVDNFGFHGMVQHKNKSYYINPLNVDENKYYIAAKSDFESNSFTCLFEDDKMVHNIEEKISREQKVVNDGLLRTFRLALACTGEYATYHINAAGMSEASDSEKKGVVLSAMNVTMTRVNGIFENDLSLTMELVPNNDEIIFLDEDTDGYSNGQCLTLAFSL